MTDITIEAIKALTNLSSDRREELAALVLHLAQSDDEPEAIDPADLPGVLKGLEQAKKGQFATVEQIERAFRRFDT